jgi:hypothetical protein
MGRHGADQPGHGVTMRAIVNPEAAWARAQNQTSRSAMGPRKGPCVITAVWACAPAAATADWAHCLRLSFIAECYRRSSRVEIAVRTSTEASKTWAGMR